MCTFSDYVWMCDIYLKYCMFTSLFTSSKLLRLTDVVIPERQKLRFFPKVPHQVPGQRVVKMTKRLDLIRGEEEVHTNLLHRQYGIIVRKIPEYPFLLFGNGLCITIFIVVFVLSLGSRCTVFQSVA